MLPLRIPQLARQQLPFQGIDFDGALFILLSSSRLASCHNVLPPLHRNCPPAQSLHFVILRRSTCIVHLSVSSIPYTRYPHYLRGAVAIIREPVPIHAFRARHLIHYICVHTNFFIDLHSIVVPD